MIKRWNLAFDKNIQILCNHSYSVHIAKLIPDENCIPWTPLKNHTKIQVSKSSMFFFYYSAQSLSFCESFTIHRSFVIRIHKKKLSNMCASSKTQKNNAHLKITAEFCCSLKNEKFIFTKKKYSGHVADLFEFLDITPS
jgi:hypothetical protein